MVWCQDLQTRVRSVSSVALKRERIAESSLVMKRTGCAAGVARAGRTLVDLEAFLCSQAVQLFFFSPMLSASALRRETE